MRNKSKLEKRKQGNEKKKECPREWLYLNETQVTPRNITEAFAENELMEAQLWEDAGVVEIELPGEAKSMDMEMTAADFGDAYSDAYFAQNHIKTVFLVTIRPEDYDAAKQAMGKIITSLGGYFCGDTEDFTPVVKDAE